MIRPRSSVPHLVVASLVMGLLLAGCGSATVKMTSGAGGGPGMTGGAGGGTAGQGGAAAGTAGRSGNGGGGGNVGAAGQGGLAAGGSGAQAGAGGGTGGQAGAGGIAGSAGGGSGGHAGANAGGSSGHGGGAGTGTGGNGTGGSGTGGNATGGTVGTGGIGGAAGAGHAGSGGHAGGGAGGTSAGGASGTICGFAMPNPVSSALPNPASYDTSAAGIVLDNVTGLAWEQTLSASMYSQSGAAAYCTADRLGGFSDWRLPTVLELGTLMDFNQPQGTPMLDTVRFPNTPNDNTRTSWFQTSTPVAGAPTKSWYVDFQNGNNFIDVAGTGRVRCVRVQKVTSSRCYTPGNRYVSTTTGGISTKLDTATGLTWQVGTSPQDLAWADAVSYCSGLAGGFRAPSIKEMQTIVDYTVASPGPTIDTTVFPLPSPPSYYYWTSSPLSGVPTGAWLMAFDTGSLSWNGGNAQYLARCVH